MQRPGFLRCLTPPTLYRYSLQSSSRFLYVWGNITGGDGRMGHSGPSDPGARKRSRRISTGMPHPLFSQGRGVAGADEKRCRSPKFLWPATEKCTHGRYASQVGKKMRTCDSKLSYLRRPLLPGGSPAHCNLESMCAFLFPEGQVMSLPFVLGFPCLSTIADRIIPVRRSSGGNDPEDQAGTKVFAPSVIPIIHLGRSVLVCAVVRGNVAAHARLDRASLLSGMML